MQTLAKGVARNDLPFVQVRGEHHVLTIRKVQEHVLLDGVAHQFEVEMLAHLHSYFPVDYRLLGKRRARALVRLGFERAAAHGFHAKGEICQFIDLSLALGSHFDQDPLLPWVPETLAASSEQDSGTRMDRLHDRALEYLDEAMGENGEHYIRAMLRARRLILEELPASNADLEAAARTWLEHLHPEKYRGLTGSELAPFFALADDQATRYGIQTDAAAWIFLSLSMFMLGSRFPLDPSHAWALSVLENDDVGEQSLKGEALFRGAQAHLERALALIRAERAG